MHPAALDPETLLKDCTVTAGRASGPGGQNRNKVETAIRITHRPTSTRATATERRHKEQNKQQALFRLRIKLAINTREPIDPAAPPTPLWQSRTKQRKLLINPTHQDFPALLAEALDRAAIMQHDLAAAAESLGVSTSQLLKLLKHEPEALDALNRSRQAQGLRPLR